MLKLTLFDSNEPGPHADYCNKSGAAKIKQMIEDYWRMRGHHVTVDLVDARFNAVMRSTRVDVRSDMVNGLPRSRAPALPSRQEAA